MPRFTVRDFGKSLQFTGNPDFVDCGTPTNLGLSGDASFTLACYVFPQETIIDGAVVSYGAAASLRVISISYADSVGTLKSVHYSTDHSYTKKIIFGQWQFIAITYDSVTSTETLYHYHGGNLTTETWSPPDLNLQAGDKLYIGRASWSDAFTASSLLDETMLFSAALSSSEIDNLYFKGEYSTTNLVGHWKFDEGSGSTATDETGNNNGTITGSTYSTNVFMRPRTVVS